MGRLSFALGILLSLCIYGLQDQGVNSGINPAVPPEIMVNRDFVGDDRFEVILNSSLEVMCIVSDAMQSLVTIQCGDEKSSGQDITSVNVEVTLALQNTTCYCMYQRAGQIHDTSFYFDVFYGPDQVNISTSSGMSNFSLCPTSVSELEVTCSYSNSSVNPGVDVTFSGIPGFPTEAVDLITNQDVVTSYFRARPMQPGNFQMNCTAENFAAPISTESLMYVDIYQPPGDSPKMSLNGNDVPNTETKTLYENDVATVVCTVDGGYPAVSSVSLDCMGERNTSLATDSMLELVVNRTFDQGSCVCSYEHVSDCQTQTTSFSFFVPYGPDQVNISTSSGMYNFSLCPSSVSELEVTCSYSNSSVNPGVDVTFSGIPGFPTEAVDLITNQDVVTSYFRARPMQPGNFQMNCTAENFAAPISTESLMYVDIYQPPGDSPKMSLNGNDVPNTETKTLYENDVATVVCTVDGGYPAVSTVSLDCMGERNTSLATDSMLELVVNRTFDQGSCVCSYEHVSDCQTQTTSFSFFVPYGPDQVEIDASSGMNDFSLCLSSDSELEVRCSYTKTSVNPEVDVTLSGIPGFPIKPSDESIDQDIVTSIFRARPTQPGNFQTNCSAENTAAPFSAESPMMIHIYQEPENSPKMTLNGEDVSDGEIKTVNLDANITIQCSVDSGYPAVSSVSLDCMGEQITSLGTESMLELEVNRTFHEGRCVCSYEHVSDCQNKTTTFSFDVRFPPTIHLFTINSKTDDTVEMSKGDEAEFLCTAEGGPNPEVSFVLSTDAAIESLENGDDSMEGHFVKTVTVNEVMGCGRSGKYSCRASNGEGEAVKVERNVWVKCGAELFNPRISVVAEGPVFKANFTISIYPNPTRFKLFKIRSRGSIRVSGRGRRDVADDIEVEPTDYRVDFTRINPQYGNVVLQWFDAEDKDELDYDLVVLNGLNDDGISLPFNISRSNLFKSSASTSNGSTSGDSSYIALLASCIVASIVIIVLAALFCYNCDATKKHSHKLKSNKTKSMDVKRRRQAPRGFANGQYVWGAEQPITWVQQ